MSRRLFLFRLLVINFFLILVGQLFRLQIIEGTHYAGQAEQNRIRKFFTQTLRGVIYDRTGKLMVRNIPSFSISILPADLPCRHGAADFCSVVSSAPQQSEEVVIERLARLLQMERRPMS